MDDPSIVKPLSEAAARLSTSQRWQPQEAANSLWSCASLGLKDMDVILPLARSAIRLSTSPLFNC
jgi:hypothetical protein